MPENPPLIQGRKLDVLRAEVDRVRADNARMLHRQYLGDHADRALAALRDAYAEDRISLEQLEATTEDIIGGRPTRLPFNVRVPRAYGPR